MKIAHLSPRLLLCLVLLLPLSAPVWSQSEEVPEVDDAPAPKANTKAAPAPIELKRMPRLTVIVEGLKPEVGEVEVSVFNTTETFMIKPFLQHSGIPDADGKFQVLFPNMLEGEYGVVVVHDENGNGLYDSGFLGFGAEPVGYSLDAKPWLGRPAFEAVSFEVQADLEVVIHMEQ